MPTAETPDAELARLRELRKGGGPIADMYDGRIKELEQELGVPKAGAPQAQADGIVTTPPKAPDAGTFDSRTRGRAPGSGTTRGEQQLWNPQGVASEAEKSKNAAGVQENMKQTDLGALSTLVSAGSGFTDSIATRVQKLRQKGGPVAMALADKYEAQLNQQ